jgi:hypothetical protein
MNLEGISRACAALSHPDCVQNHQCAGTQERIDLARLRTEKLCEELRVVTLPGQFSRSVGRDASVAVALHLNRGLPGSAVYDLSAARQLGSPIKLGKKF